VANAITGSARLAMPCSDWAGAAVVVAVAFAVVEAVAASPTVVATDVPVGAKGAATVTGGSTGVGEDGRAAAMPVGV
jgi:hypothetical protein